MGSLGQQEHERETLQQGHLPISNRRSFREGESSSLSILGPGELESWDLVRIGGITAAANRSWALLLRTYIRTNSVLFGLLNNGRSIDAETLHYRLLDHSRLDEINAVDNRGRSNIQHSHIDINTAVNYITNPGFLHCVGDERQQWEQAGSINPVRSLLNILIIQIPILHCTIVISAIMG